MDDLRTAFELISSEFLPGTCTVHLLEDREVILVAPTKTHTLVYVTLEDIRSRSRVELIRWIGERMRQGI